MRNPSLQQAQQSDCHRHLTALLSPLDDSPELLASRLLYRFGSIGRIAQASENDLRTSAGSGETWVDALLVVRQLMHDGMREELIRTRLGEDRDALYSYLLMTMQNLSEERMLAIFADSAGFVIAEEVVAEGGAAHVLLSPRRIFGRALNLDARRLLLVHNHPSGCAEPSRIDVEQTKVLCRQATDLGLCIEDHLIVGCRQVISMKERGLM
jgi:DNA repair protein RadC